MTRNLILILIIAVASCGVRAQDFPTTLKEYAVNIERLDSLNDEVYNLIYDYRLIMIGEMHGTNEPAKFVIGLAELLTSKGDSVQVGMEIPSSAMTDYLQKHTDSSVYTSEFFAKGSVDGRASVAWAELIFRLSRNGRVKIFFYDTNVAYNEERDSNMYVNIKKEMLAHPAWKTITLSGNIHNMLLLRRGQKKAGHFLANDTALKLGDKICSLNHYYQTGTMNNNSGKGLAVYDVGNIESKYSIHVDYENYLFLFPLNYPDTYSGIYFTRKVTAAKVLNE